MRIRSRTLIIIIIVFVISVYLGLVLKNQIFSSELKVNSLVKASSLVWEGECGNGKIDGKSINSQLTCLQFSLLNHHCGEGFFCEWDGVKCIEGRCGIKPNGEKRSEKECNKLSKIRYKCVWNNNLNKCTEFIESDGCSISKDKESCKSLNNIFGYRRCVWYSNRCFDTNNRCGLPIGSKLLFGTSKEKAEKLECYRYGIVPALSFVCPLTSNEISKIITNVNGKGLNCKEKSNDLEKIKCVGDGVSNFLNILAGKQKIHAYSHAFCVHKLLHIDSMKPIHSVYVSSPSPYPYVRTFTVHNIDTTNDGKEDSMLIFDTFHQIYYTIPK